MKLTRRLKLFPASLAIGFLCLLTFGLQIAHEPLDTMLGRLTDFELQYAFVPVLAADEPWRWVTAPFLHIAPWHLLNNLGFVLILGSWLEEDLGSLRIAALFAAGALAGEAFYMVAGDQMDVVLGASGGLMAIAGAALIAERRANFANYRQRLAGVTIAATVLLSIGAPALGALGAHVVGALTGVVLGFVLPPPLRARARHEAEQQKAVAEWQEAKAAVMPAGAADSVFVLKPTPGRTLAVAATGVLVVAAGASMALQSVFISDTTSATIAVIAGLWTVGIGFLLWARIRVAPVSFDSSGMGRGKWRQTWSEVEQFYPGRIYSGLFAMGAIGFLRKDGTRFTLLSAGHRVRTLALRLEAIRLAAA